MNILIALMFLFAVVFVVLSILIVRELAKRDVKINILFLRFLMPKYVHDYKKITEKESGKPGPLFYPWIISINLALLCFILFLVL